MDGFMDHEPVKISILIFDVLCDRLRWRARYHMPALVVAVTGSINEVVVALEQLPRPIPPLDPPTSLTTEIFKIFENFLFIIGRISLTSLNVLIAVTLFLLEK